MRLGNSESPAEDFWTEDHPIEEKRSDRFEKLWEEIKVDFFLAVVLQDFRWSRRSRYSSRSVQYYRKTPRSTISIEYFVAVEIHITDSLICWRFRFEIFRNESKHNWVLCLQGAIGVNFGRKGRGEASLTEPIFDLPSNSISFERS